MPAVHFDMSNFVTICTWLFNTGKTVFDMLNFDFFGYTLNGWVILIGVAVVFLVIRFFARILE